MIKLVATDLDGTVLNSKSEVLSSTVEKIETYRKKGVDFAFCTGRAFVEMDEIIKKLPQMKYAITANGAYIYEIKTDKILSKTSFSKPQIQQIYKRIRPYDASFELYLDGKIYCDSKSKKYINDFVPVQYHKLLNDSRTFVDDMDDFIKNFNGEPIKIHIFFSTTSMRDKVYEEVKDMPYDIANQGINELEFSPKGVNKGYGIKKLSEFLGIEKQQVMAMGDNVNDIPMRESAGILVAMQNAVDDFKKISDFITKSNDDNGISHALDKFLK